MHGLLAASSALLLVIWSAGWNKRPNIVAVTAIAFAIVGLRPALAIADTSDVHLMLKDEGANIHYVLDDEVDYLVAEDWSDMGVAWVAPEISRTPVYRLYNANVDDHHFTTSVEDRDVLVRAGWKYEAIGWYSDDQRNVPIYRLYNPNAQSHYLTASRATRDEMVSSGWRAEGIQCYAIEAGPAADCCIDVWVGAPFEILSIGAQSYTGSAIEPPVRVKLCDRLLTEGSDYALSYSNNIEAGLASVTVTGKGQYSSARETVASFEIEKLDISTMAIGYIPSQTYTGKEIKPAVRVTDGSTVLSEGVDYEIAYKDNVRVGTAIVSIFGVGNYAGTVTTTFQINASTQEMHRLYNPYSGEHFYTASTVECATLEKLGWKYEGVGWVAPVSSYTPVYRLYNANAGDHHYTTSAKERDALVRAGWKYEAIGWYSDDAEGTPLYRQYNPNAVAGSHNYTTSTRERDVLVGKYGWHDEGIGWYGVKR